MVCNKCGREVKASKVNTNFEFCTSIFNMDWDMNLCDTCLMDIILEFKFAPKHFMQETSDTLITDKEEQTAFEMWKETGNWDYLCGVPYEKLIALADYHGIEYINEMIERYHPNESLIEVVN